MQQNIKINIIVFNISRSSRIALISTFIFSWYNCISVQISKVPKSGWSSLLAGLQAETI